VKKTVWIVSDTSKWPGTELGPYFTRAEAELAARKIGFQFLVQYQYEIGHDLSTTKKPVCAVQIFPDSDRPALHTLCATCGLTAHHHYQWQAEVWADIHEFEHSRHLVRLLIKTDDAGLLEVPNWRQCDWVI
jgi:hypothetical protein